MNETLWKIVPILLIALIVSALVALVWLTFVASIWLLNEIGRHYGIWTLLAILIVVICCMFGGRETKTIIVKTRNG